MNVPETVLDPPRHDGTVIAVVRIGVNNSTNPMTSRTNITAWY